jgi:hypothetical protein
MTTRKFWPLDYDPEDEIYENLAWDLPGYRRSRQQRPPKERIRFTSAAGSSTVKRRRR